MHLAIGRYEKALIIQPDHVKSLTLLGAALHDASNTDMAENRLAHALRLDPSNHIVRPRA